MADRNDRERSTPVSRSRRFMKLAGMTASVAGSYARNRVRGIFNDDEELEAQNWREAGERIARTLGELKGAVMKVGQVASQARDLLPPEISEALASLQNEAPPMPYEVIAEQIEKEFGVPPDGLFASFEREPFAAASIGQVHRAVTDDGRQVVVKVQYPGVDESCDSDLRQLKFALRAAGVMRLNKQAMNELFEELRARLHEELDYTNEAENVRLFRDFHRDDEGVIVPDVVGERSSKRILTLTWEPGDRLDRLNPEDYDQETRNLIGRRMFHLFARQIFELGVVHGDPHPGNFAFRPDGTVVMYDYGCVKKLKPGIVEAYKDTVVAGIRDEWERVDRGLMQLGARLPEGPALSGEFYGPWRDIFLRPFLAEEPYHFANADLHKRFVKKAPEVLKHLDSLRPPVETVFIDRVIGGHYWTMVKLEVVASFRQELQQLFGLSEEDLERHRPAPET